MSEGNSLITGSESIGRVTIDATQKLMGIYGENEEGDKYGVKNVIKTGKLYFLTSAYMQRNWLQIRIHCLDKPSIEVSLPEAY